MREWDKYLQGATIGIILTIIVFGMLALYASAILDRPQSESYISNETRAKHLVKVRANKCFKCHRGV